MSCNVNAITVFVLAAVLAVATVSAGKGGPLWKVKLPGSTFDPHRHVWAFNPGYSATVGSLYLTTDLNETLYAISTANGSLAWSYGEWPALPFEVAANRQIAGNAAVVTVLRGNVLYGLNATTGALLYNLTYDNLQNPTMYTFAGQTFLARHGAFSLLSVETGDTLWEVKGVVNQPVQTGLTDTLIAAIIADKGAQYLRVYNASSNGALVSEALVTSPFPLYIFWVTREFVLYFEEAYDVEMQRVHRIHTPTGRQQFNVTLPGIIGGYGVGSVTFYFQFGLSLASFNLTTGALVAYTGQIPNIGTIEHLVGYDTFAILAMTTSSPSVLNISSFDVRTMRVLWSQSVTAIDQFMYANWPGALAVPSEHGMTIINGNTGVTVWNATTGYSNIVTQSMVLDNTHLYFTYGPYATAIEYHL